MRHESTAVYERDADWVVAYCPAVPDVLARKICRGLGVPELGR